MTAELRQLAEAAQAGSIVNSVASELWYQYREAANPQAIVQLLDELDKAEKLLTKAEFLCDTFQLHDYPELECLPLVQELEKDIADYRGICPICGRLKSDCPGGKEGNHESLGEMQSAERHNIQQRANCIMGIHEPDLPD